MYTGKLVFASLMDYVPLHTVRPRGLLSEPVLLLTVCAAGHPAARQDCFHTEESKSPVHGLSGHTGEGLKSSLVGSTTCQRAISRESPSRSKNRSRGWRNHTSSAALGVSRADSTSLQGKGTHYHHYGLVIRS